MIHHVKYIWFFIALATILACKNKTNFAQEKDNQLKKIEIDTSSQHIWKFSAIYPIGSFDTTNINSTRTFFENVSFKLETQSIEIIGIGNEEIYSNKLAAQKYFKQDYLKDYYENLFYKNYKESLPDSITSIRNKNAHQKKSILKPFFDDAFLANDFLIIEKDGFSIFYVNILTSQNSLDKKNNKWFDTIL